MSNRYTLTLLHWITTIIIGSILSGVLSQWLHTGSLIPTVQGIIELCILFSGLFSLPVFLFALYFIPKLLIGHRTRSQQQLLLSVISAGFVIAGFIIAGLFLVGIAKLLEEFSYVLIGFCLSAVLSSMIRIRLYKSDSNKLQRELDTIDSDLLN